MGETALAKSSWEAGLDGPDQARCPVGDDEQRVGQPPAFQVFEEGRTARRVLLGPRRQVPQHLAPVLRDSPGTEHRFARHPGVQPLRHAVDEQVGHDEFAEIAGGEGLVLGKQEQEVSSRHRRSCSEAPWEAGEEQVGEWCMPRYDVSVGFAS
jgi:hypothetical protein